MHDSAKQLINEISEILAVLERHVEHSIFKNVPLIDQMGDLLRNGGFSNSMVAREPNSSVVFEFLEGADDGNDVFFTPNKMLHCIRKGLHKRLVSFIDRLSVLCIQVEHSLFRGVRVISQKHEFLSFEEMLPWPTQILHRLLGVFKSLTNSDGI